jgi:hypothetical protein
VTFELDRLLPGAMTTPGNARTQFSDDCRLLNLAKLLRVMQAVAQPPQQGDHRDFLSAVTGDKAIEVEVHDID